ncbi:4-hydroxyphenylpyruvate dioxygenase [Phytohabitans sp. ZYX-F-186]|uniref:4-hydroxyphenylpyruvate dioxygenase n=1 Tax=Phytohabitans maris TaxID=3071409 RepID=A0ABU0ZV17_9ACTN|nr:4-hydroxyphenylpyruvate dioxygenase [Phytohabitans sp. ZYX-F-186]MDQ7910879.1 4-hydroxyphenylpyruvate dioxygenase [Phytohabitans sp. ZYX-F-186]
MDVTTVDHVEFYAGDAERTARLLVEAYGFRRLGHGGPGLPGQHTLLLGQGGIRVLVTAATDPAHPVAAYVRRHGDGVARIGLRVTDAAEAYAQALRRGAAPVAEPRSWGTDVVTAEVCGPGALAHRLVERRGSAGPFLPGGIEPLPAAPAPSTPDLLETVDHTALCVAGGALDEAVRFYTEVFEFKEIFEERVEVGGQAMESKVVQSGSGEVTFTIVAPDPALRPGQLDDFLRANGGAGVQHLALSTRDIAAAVATLGARGVHFLKTPASYYDAIERRLGEVSLSVAALRAGNILVDRDHWGEMFQIFTVSSVERRTFFFELIERHGALTFGSNNIKALYEAKERARAAAQAGA